MRRICLVLSSLVLCCNWGDAMAVRSQNTQTTNVRQTSRTKTDSGNRSVSTRTATQNTTKRSASARNASNKVVTERNTPKKTIVARSASKAQRIVRAAATVKTRTFGTNYNSCRDAYFTCMDQFCATQNENYRRCVCSSKLKNIQNQEKL